MINYRYITDDVLHKNNSPKSDIKSPIYFDVGSPYYYKEEWRLITGNIIPHIRENVYWISNHGRFYSNLISNRNPYGILGYGRPNRKGYLEITVRRNSGNGNGCRITLKIHRLVMMMFRYKPGCEFLEIDHIDSNKNNNCLYNLQWINHTTNNNRKYIDSGKIKIPVVEGIFYSENDIFDLFDKYFSGKFTIDDLAISYNMSINNIYNLIRGYVNSDYIENYRNIHPNFNEELLNGELSLDELKMYIKQYS